MIKISKELLSEVLKEDVLSVKPYIDNDPFYKNIIMWEYRKNTYDTINIYELAHKCKEWALSKDYKLVSLNKECFLYDTQYLYDVSEQLNQWSEWFEADSEVEAIFKACEWVLKEIKR